MEAENKQRKHSTSDDEDDDSKIFPQKLMEILADETHSEAICWLPHGKAFTIRNRELFAEKVMPQFFSRKAKYSSFTRKLNRWNFTRCSSGPELGSYYHQYFRRDKPQLVAQMFCKNARSKLAMAADNDKPTISMASNSSPASAPREVHPPVPPTATTLSAGFRPLLMAALEKEGREKESAYAAAASSLAFSSAPVLGVNNLHLLERQVQLMQEEYARRLLLQQLALKEQMATNKLQQQQLFLQQQMQQQQADAAALARMRQLMELRARQRRGMTPRNGRASAA